MIYAIRGYNAFASCQAFIREICKICIILKSDYFSLSFLGLSLSNHGAKSKNDFAATENEFNEEVDQVTDLFLKVRIFAESQKSKFLLRRIVS